MLYFIIGILCFILGILVGILFFIKTRKFGTIKSMVDDATGEIYLYLDMDRQPGSMGFYKYVVFKTDLSERTPQK